MTKGRDEAFKLYSHLYVCKLFYYADVNRVTVKSLSKPSPTYGICHPKPSQIVCSVKAHWAFLEFWSETSPNNGINKQTNKKQCWRRSTEEPYRCEWWWARQSGQHCQKHRLILFPLRRLFFSCCHRSSRKKQTNKHMETEPRRDPSRPAAIKRRKGWKDPITFETWWIS